MSVKIGRNNETLRLANPIHLWLKNVHCRRGFSGDIVGLCNSLEKLRIGDTLAEGKAIKFDGIPRFAPEHFSRVVLKDPMKRKGIG